jgi:hypothetical protein
MSSPRGLPTLPRPIRLHTRAPGTANYTIGQVKMVTYGIS